MISYSRLLPRDFLRPGLPQGKAVILLMAEFLFGVFFAVALNSGPLKSSKAIVALLPIDIGVAIILVAGLLGGVCLTLHKGWPRFCKAFASPLGIYLVFLWVYVLLSILFGRSLVNAQTKLIGFFGVGGALMVLAVLAAHYRASLVGMFFGCALITAYLVPVMWTSISGEMSISLDRDLFEDYLFLGRFFAILAAYCVLALMVPFRLSQFQRMALLLGALAFSGAVFTVAARGPFVSVACAWIMYAWWIMRQYGVWRGGVVRILAVVLVLGTAGMLLNPDLLELLFGRGLERFGLIVGGGGAGMGESAGARVNVVFPVAINGWVSHPVFGTGYGGFSYLLEMGDMRAYPHNIVLETLCELGTVGFLLFLGFWLLIFKKLRAIRTVDPLLFVISAALLGMVFIQSQFSGDLADNREILVVAGLLMGGAARHKFAESFCEVRINA